jgi:hypothetical protein
MSVRGLVKVIGFTGVWMFMSWDGGCTTLLHYDYVCTLSNVSCKVSLSKDQMILVLRSNMKWP